MKKTKEIDQTPSTLTQATPPSAAVREKDTKKIKDLVQQCHYGHYTGDKYYLPTATNRYNTIVNSQQGMIVETAEHHIELLATSIQVQHQANLVIDPTTGSYL